MIGWLTGCVRALKELGKRMGVSERLSEMFVERFGRSLDEFLVLWWRYPDHFI